LRFAVPGVAGTIVGSQLGLLTPSNGLLILFGIFMIIISVRMLTQSTKIKSIKIKNSSTAVIAKDKVYIMENNHNHDDDDDDSYKNNKFNNVKNNYSKNEDKSVNVLADASNLYNKSTNTNNLLKLLTTGFLVGLAAGYFGIGGGFVIVPSLMHLGLNIIDAIGTSLIPVSMFGFSTAIRYSFNNQIEWVVALLFIVGGIFGGMLGTRFASKLPKKTLSVVFAFLLIVVALYIISKSVLLVV
ncbi:MAG: sulfite exporter TauE/SafE family protein, partial [Nitrososphaeraceae archaeon]